MILIAIAYIFISFELKKTEKLRRQNSSYSVKRSEAQMTKISRTFMIILLAFYIGYLPSTIMNVLYVLPDFYTYINLDKFNTAFAVTNFLWFTNSSLNPIIYSKIHVKIYNYVKTLTTKCGSSTNIVNQKRQQPTTINIVCQEIKNSH